MDSEDIEIFADPLLVLDFERNGRLGKQSLDLSPDINDAMRCILIDWLMEVWKSQKCLVPTFFATISILDAYTSRVGNVRRNDYQLLCCATMSLAEKYYEIYAMESETYIHLSEEAFDEDELNDKELEVFRALGQNINFPNELDILRALSTMNYFTAEIHDITKYLLIVCCLNSGLRSLLPTVLVTACALITSKYFQHTFDNNFYNVPEDIRISAEERIRKFLFVLIQTNKQKAWKDLRRFDEQNEQFEEFINKIAVSMYDNVCMDVEAYTKDYYFVSDITKDLIPIEEFVSERDLGSGAFGDVFRVQYKDKSYAKKVNRGFDEGLSVGLIREYSILSTLNHPNVVSLSYFTTDIYSMVMPLADCDLRSRLNKMPMIGDQMYRQLAIQLLTGLDYIHSNGCLHRDIKPQNILVFGGNTSTIFKLADFGSARGTHIGIDFGYYTNKISTLWYRAPEILLGSVSYNSKVDVWAMMCTLYECDMIKPLFTGDSQIDQLYKIFRVCGTPTEETWPDISKYQESRLDIWPKWHGSKLNGIGSLCKKLLESGLKIDPSKRPTAKQLLAIAQSYK